MSLETWETEFYDYKLTSDAASEQEADVNRVEHSLKKWRGLTSENLEKHGIVRISHLIMDKAHRLGIDARSCALCVKHLSMIGEPCGGCPLYKVLGARCDQVVSGGIPVPVYTYWLNTGDPQPMIAALERALAYTKAQVESNPLEESELK